MMAIALTILPSHETAVPSARDGTASAPVVDNINAARGRPAASRRMPTSYAAPIAAPFSF